MTRLPAVRARLLGTRSTTVFLGTVHRRLSSLMHRLTRAHVRVETGLLPPLHVARRSSGRTNVEPWLDEYIKVLRLFGDVHEMCPRQELGAEDLRIVRAARLYAELAAPCACKGACMVVSSCMVVNEDKVEQSNAFTETYCLRLGSHTRAAALTCRCPGLHVVHRVLLHCGESYPGVLAENVGGHVHAATAGCEVLTCCEGL